MSHLTEDRIDYAIYEHHDNAGRKTHGGYVVRSRRNGWAPAPYSNVPAVAVYETERGAQHYADKMNRSEGS